MQKFLLPVLLLLLVACQKEITAPELCLPVHLYQGMIAFYPFTNGSLNDGSGRGNTLGNPTSAHPVEDRYGNANCAFSFVSTPANEDFLTTRHTKFLDSLDAFSISLWFMPGIITGWTQWGKTLEVLVSRGGDMVRCPDRRGEWSLGLYDCRNAVFGHNNSVWAMYNIHCDQDSPVLNNWHHVVAVKNHEEYRIYLNGIMYGIAHGDGACTLLHQAQDIGDLFIGKKFTGAIDDVIIYNRALTTNEVVELYYTSPCCDRMPIHLPNPGINDG